MDGDGEDRPEEISLLIEIIKDIQISCYSNRVKRSEGSIFKFCYLVTNI